MSTVTHLGGSMERATEAALPGLLDELVAADAEHTDVAVTHDDGVSLSVFASGRLVVEDVKEGSVGPVWATSSDRAVVLRQMRAVMEGEFAVSTSGLEWSDGYGPPVGPASGRAADGERARLTGGEGADQVPAGVGLVSFEVTASARVQDILDRAREVLLVAQGMTAAEHASAAASTVLTVLPAWFMAACTPEPTEEERDRWLARWRALPPSERARAEAEQGWTARSWLSWIDPDDRPWTWWDARVLDEHRARVRVEVTGWPTPTGALECLLRAAGADHVVVVDPPG